MATAELPEPTPTPVCSARGCQAPAAWALLWNNPRLHTADRRKTWLACNDHRDTLGDFLRARSFLRAVEPMDIPVSADGERTPSTG
jgi:hypothetical protein